MNSPNNSSERNNFSISQDIEIMQPVTSKGYAISCKEWDLLKSKIKSIKDDVNWYLTFGSGCFGTSLAVLISIFTVNPWRDTNGDLTTKIIIYWAVFTVAIIISVALFIFAHQHKEITHGKSRDVLALMEIIEDRFPNIEELTETSQGTRKVESEAQEEKVMQELIDRILTILRRKDLSVSSTFLFAKLSRYDKNTILDALNIMRQKGLIVFDMEAIKANKKTQIEFCIFPQ
jgi:hypothetical protein